MKRLIAILAVLGMCSAMAFAGPTIGLGFGYYPDTVWGAPSAGMQWLGDPIGVETNLHLALLAFETGDDFSLNLGGFWEIVTITYLFPGEEDGLQWRAIGGFGTPFGFESDEDALAIVGGNLGWLVGISCENRRGTGVKVLAFLDGESVGVGITAYYDLFPAKSEEEASTE